MNFYMKDELLDETEMYPFADDMKGVSFMSPVPTSFEKYIEHIDKNMAGDTPSAFGLHPNAEIDFRTQQSNSMFKTLIELQPKGVSSVFDGAFELVHFRAQENRRCFQNLLTSETPEQDPASPHGSTDRPFLP